MFSKSALLFATLASAAFVGALPNGGSSSSSGSVQCCNSISNSGSPSTSKLLGLLGIVVQGLNVPIGLDCSPISAVGVGGTTCESNTVNCQNIFSDGLVGVDCVPVNVGL